MTRHIDEQNYLDFVRLNVELKKDEIEELLNSSAVGGAGPKSGRAISEKLVDRKENLPNPNEPYFVRIDLTNGETLYYGFSTLTKAAKSPATPVSHPGIDHYLTYSRVNDGQGWTVFPIENFNEVVSRTRFQIKNGKLLKFEEDSKGDIPQISKNTDVTAAEQLKDVMSETRTESLRPVGATLQPDQFLITREAIGAPLTIQGPPGSGKTVVLLERLARIGFADKVTRERGMLLVGPNQQFLEYVKDALDILGSSDVILTTPEDLTSWKFTKNPDVEEIKYIKGFSSFMAIIDNYFANLPSILDSGYNLKIADIEVHFSVIDSLNLIEMYKSDKGTYQQIRNRAGNSVANLLVERFFQTWESKGKQRTQFDGDPLKLIQTNSTYRTILRNIYPEITADSVLKTLKKSPKVFIECAQRLLTEDQIRLWLENVVEHDYEIRESDVAILDYIDFRIRGNEENWGHIAVDEAQDLTPMQFLMLKRRVYSANSITLTGDLAQATGALFYETWDEISKYFTDQKPKHTELTRSYRVPSEILQFANTFLHQSNARVKPAEPFLEIAESLEQHYPIDSNDLNTYSHWIVEEAINNNQSVLVVGDSETVSFFNKQMANLPMEKHFKAYLAEEVKGLEFDVVVLVSPLKIISELDYEADRIARLFYVLSTRSTKKLHIIGSGELEVTDPIEYMNQLRVAIEDGYEPQLELAARSNEELINDINSAAIEIQELVASNSIPGLCHSFGLNIATQDPFMLSNDWFYLGMASIPCVDCGYRQQQIFRKHYKNSSGKESHPGCLVCLSCLVARNGSEYSNENLQKVDNDLSFEDQRKIICKECANV